MQLILTLDRPDKKEQRVGPKRCASLAPVTLLEDCQISRQDRRSQHSWRDLSRGCAGLSRADKSDYVPKHLQGLL